MSIASLKEQGNKEFAAKNYPAAIEFYTKAIDSANADEDISVLLSNRSLAHLKNNDIDDALADADDCVMNYPNFAKGFVRLGMAYEARNHLPFALFAFATALDLDGSSSEVAQKVRDIKKKVPQSQWPGIAHRQPQPRSQQQAQQEERSSLSAAQFKELLLNTNDSRLDEGQLRMKQMFKKHPEVMVLNHGMNTINLTALDERKNAQKAKDTESSDDDDDNFDDVLDYLAGGSKTNTVVVFEPTQWTDGLSEKEQFEFLLDVYRVRVDDAYVYHGDAIGLYQAMADGDTVDPLVENFFIFCKLAHNVVPAEWNWSGFLKASLGVLPFAFENSDAVKKYEKKKGLYWFDANGGESCRVLGDVVYGLPVRFETQSKVCRKLEGFMYQEGPFENVLEARGGTVAFSLFDDVGGKKEWRKLYNALQRSMFG